MVAHIYKTDWKTETSKMIHPHTHTHRNEIGLGLHLHYRYLSSRLEVTPCQRSMRGKLLSGAMTPAEFVRVPSSFLKTLKEIDLKRFQKHVQNMF